jgi:large subunit ribosomal protein L18e
MHFYSNFYLRVNRVSGKNIFLAFIKMQSNTKIEKQLKRKTNPELVKTIIATKKSESWKEVAKIISGSRKKRKNVNLWEINKKTEEGEKVIVLGKVLSNGEINKKVEIIALDFSNKAKEKILKAKGNISSILDEIKKNPEMKGLKVLK